MDLSSLLEKRSSYDGIQNVYINMIDEQKIGTREDITLNQNTNMIKQTTIDAAGSRTMNNNILSNLVFAVMNDEDASKEFAFAMKNIAENKQINSVDRNDRCEFSLHEVLSGCAKVPRLNGEQPKVW